MDPILPLSLSFWEEEEEAPACPHLSSLSLQEEDDYDVMQDPEFLQSVLENLPGVDPNNEAIRNAMGSLASQASKESKDKDRKSVV